MGLDKFIMSFS